MRTMRQIRLICFKARANHSRNENSIAGTATLRVEKKTQYQETPEQITLICLACAK